MNRPVNRLRWILPGLAGALIFASRLAAQDDATARSDATPLSASPGQTGSFAMHSRRWILAGLDGAAVICFVVWWRRMGRRASRVRASVGALTRFEPVG